MIKIIIAKFVKALSLQFTQAPHYVEYTHEEDGHTVNLRTGCSPQLDVCRSIAKVEKAKAKLSITLFVPNNGGLRDVFGVETSGDAESKQIAGLIRGAIAAAEEVSNADPKVETL